MAHFVRVGAAALNQTPLAWENNVTNILKVISDAQEKGVEFLCLPELCITGYGCEDAFLAEYVSTSAIKALELIRQNTKGIAVVVGLPIRIHNALYNCAVFLANNRLLGIVPKQNLASDGIHYEPRWFKAWPAGQKVSVKMGQTQIPVGDLVFKINGTRIGFEICEDAWVVGRPGNSLAKRAVDVILNPSASHFAFGKNKIRKGFVLEGSRAFHCTYVYANLLGNEAGRVVYDGDTMIAQNGKMITQGDRFMFDNHSLITADVNLERTRTERVSNGSFRPDFSDADVEFNFDPLDKSKVPKFPSQPEDEDKYEPNKFDEFEDASALALFDYMRKSHSKGFVLSLSGGADSSAVACMVNNMVDTGVEKLGRDNFLAKAGLKIDFDEDLSDEEKNGQVLSNILTCVYQGTTNSSPETFASAGLLAETLNANFINWSVDDLKSLYIEKIEGAIGRNLNWTHDDIALQNIQARVRAPGVWMLANIQGALLLSTSNRSEAAVGYATMDGDTCGGLSPIAGVDKQFILDWLKHLQEDRFYAAALADYNNLVPTAELRPSDMKQTDEDDLMPYPVLELIEEYAIRDKMSPQDIVAYLSALQNYKPEQITEWVTKFFTLWSRNQWKRERYAPSFHFDDENLDPKSWCRWPILSGSLV